MSRLSGAAYWERRLSRWRTKSVAATTPGYTLLIPVPGDIPVFLELALRVCATQSSAHRIRTLVIPDRPTKAIREIVRERQHNWAGPLDLTLLPRPERWLLPYLRSGSRNHGLQLIAGTEATTSSHIILHDADLFLLDPDLLDSQYEACRSRQLACLGVSPVWDVWFAEHGRQLAATWELTAATEWLRSWKPWRHMGHDADLWGERHTFDTTLWPQAQTPPQRIGVSDRSDGFVHFNYVITSFRHFQQRGSSYVDANFRLLLIALFVQLFADNPALTAVPSVAELAGGLAGSGPAHYPAPADAPRGEYADFRTRFGRALHGISLAPDQAERADRALQPFDEWYGYPTGATPAEGPQA